MFKIQKTIIVGLLLSFSANLLPAGAARQAVTRMAATGHGARAQAAVICRNLSQKAVPNIQKVKDSFRMEDWDNTWKHFPHAAAAVKDIFNGREKEPKEFEFELDEERWLYFPFKNAFAFEKNGIQEWNETLASQDVNYSLTERKSWDYKDGMRTKQDYAYMVEGIIGHELQHAFDREALKVLHSEAWNEETKIFTYTQEHIKQFRILEKKADRYCSKNPQILKALATNLEWVAQAGMLWTDNKKRMRILLKDRHPHPLKRACDLYEQAGDLDAKRKAIEKYKSSAIDKAGIEKACKEIALIAEELAATGKRMQEEADRYRKEVLKIK